MNSLLIHPETINTQKLHQYIIKGNNHKASVKKWAINRTAISYKNRHKKIMKNQKTHYLFLK